MQKFLVLIWLAAGLTIQAAVLDPAKGKTEFLAVGRPAALRINGKGDGPTGQFTLKKDAQDFLLSGEASVNLETFDTGIAMRDRHMKETYLETGKFKTATLSFKDARIPGDKIEKGGTVNVAATLALHGQQSAVEVEMTLAPGADQINTTAKFKVNLAAYGVDVPKYAGITVANEVTVTTQTEIAKAGLGETL